jgi:hypothetical protein
MLREVSGNAPKKFTMVRKIHRENYRMSVDPSLSGNKAQIIDFFFFFRLLDSILGLQSRKAEKASGTNFWLQTRIKSPTEMRELDHI